VDFVLFSENFCFLDRYYSCSYNMDTLSGYGTSSPAAKIAGSDMDMEGSSSEEQLGRPKPGQSSQAKDRDESEVQKQLVCI
jgi:hypothetical protein